MKAILEFDLNEDRDDFNMAVQAPGMYLVLWELDQWLRSNTKYAPDGTSSDTYDAYENCRNQLRDFMRENNVSFE